MASGSEASGSGLATGRAAHAAAAANAAAVAATIASYIPSGLHGPGEEEEGEEGEGEEEEVDVDQGDNIAGVFRKAHTGAQASAKKQGTQTGGRRRSSTRRS